MPFYRNTHTSYPHNYSGTEHAEVFQVTEDEAIEAISEGYNYVPEDFDGEPGDLVGFYWRTCLPGCLPDGDAHGPFAYAGAALAASRGLDPYEREQIEHIFSLGGGELNHDPLTWTDEDGDDHSRHYHYDGAPEWAADDFPDDLRGGCFSEDSGGNVWEYRTVIVDETFGEAATPAGWERVKNCGAGGETDCGWCGKGTDWDDSEEQAKAIAANPDGTNTCYQGKPDCPLCEGGGYIYLGEGYCEVVYRKLDEDQD